MKMIFDVAIIGGGISGLMAAYRLLLVDNNLSVAIFDAGKEIDQRQCPMTVNKIKCQHCKTCSITSGFAGAGAFSDGKFNLGTAYGGTLGQELSNDIANSYISQVDRIIDSFRDDTMPAPEFYSSNKELSKKCLQHNLQLLDMNVKHLGTDYNYRTMKNLIDKLKQLDAFLYPQSICEDITLTNDGSEFYKIHIKDSEDEFETRYVILATGRGGSAFVSKICQKYNVQMESNQVDIGVRVEMDDSIWKEFSDKIYEPKILYRTKTFEDTCRMFCFNKRGYVSAENNHGIITANGHAYADYAKKTNNCNFAILSSIKFTDPFDKPTEYIENISRLANMIGDGNVLVQRFGDLIRGRRTTESRLSKNTVTPTLFATPGDISLVLPHRIMTNIIETIYALNEIAPGTANDDTLLYGCESKYYSVKPVWGENKFEIVKNMYIIGDGSGVCRGLSQSGAMGLYIADKLLEKI